MLNKIFAQTLDSDKEKKDRFHWYLAQAEHEFYNNFQKNIILHKVLLNPSQLTEVGKEPQQFPSSRDMYRPVIGIWNYEHRRQGMSWSDEVNQILGFPASTAPSWDNFIAMVHPTDRSRVMELFYQSSQNEEPISLSFRILNEEGNIKHLIAQSKRVITENGSPLGLFGIIYDVTEINKIEADKERLLHVIGQSRDEIYLINTSTFQYEFVNNGAIQNTGYELEELKNMATFNLEPDFTRSDYKKIVRPLLQGEKEKLVFEAVHKRKNGTVYPVEIHLELINYGNGDVFMALVFDISERKKAENYNMERKAFLEKQNNELFDFCNIISHNLRSPLANMSMLIEAIEESESEEDNKLYISKLKPVLNHLHETFDELVESLQVRQDIGVKAEKLNMENVAKKQLESFEGQILTLEADIHCDFSEAPVVNFPMQYMSSILHNLVSNALKYKSPDRKPVISIKTERKDRSIILSVKDNGLGIDLEKHGSSLFKIRKVFHKNADAKGFGLFLTKAQVDTMGGDIWAESTPGQGSTFFVEFVHQYE